MANCVQIPRAIGAFYHVWKWHNVQRGRSEIRRCTNHALCRSKLWQQDHCGSTLDRTAQALDDPLEVVERRPKADATTRKTRTKGFIENVQVIIDETPQWSIRQIARDLGVSHTTVNACVKEVLKCRSYRHQTCQILTEKTKNFRLIKSVGLLNKLKHPKKPNMLWFFSNEKNFCQDQVHNSQNHRWIATNNRDVHRVMKTKFRLRLWSLVWFQVRATSCHLTSAMSAWKSTPKCTWMCWRVWWSPGAIRWPVTDPGCGSRTRYRPTSPKRLRLGFGKSATTLYPSLTAPPLLPTWTSWTTSFGHPLRTSPTWPPTTPKPAWSPPSAEYSPSFRWRLWKKYASSSGSVSRRWLWLKVATLNRCQLYYVIKLPELIFSIRILK